MTYKVGHEALTKQVLDLSMPETAYGLADLRSRYTTCVDVGAHPDDALLCIYGQPSGGEVHFGLYEFLRGPATPTETAEDAETWFTCTFHGIGYAGALREMRHTWWCPDDSGYSYYHNIAATRAALEHLRRYFDGT